MRSLNDLAREYKLATGRDRPNIEELDPKLREYIIWLEEKMQLSIDLDSGFDELEHFMKKERKRNKND